MQTAQKLLEAILLVGATRILRGLVIALIFYCGRPPSAFAQGAPPSSTSPSVPGPAVAPTHNPAGEKPRWQYGGFIDFGYLVDFNHPPNHLFRGRGTAFHVNEFNVNMAGIFLRRPDAKTSRWGAELTFHAGKDSALFGFSATAPNVAGAKWLRHFGPTNVSYRAPVGNGLTLQAGLFNSFIGYESLYTKDNFTYTRSWGADFTPYLMFGLNASYPFSNRWSGSVFILNGYWHLAHANNVPSVGSQLSYKPTGRVTLKQTILFGPHQAATAPEYWRFLSDSLAEWKGDSVTAALGYQFATENVTGPGSQRAQWMAAQLPLHWTFNRHWSVSARPEFAWDRDGRWTGWEQLVKAATANLEYRFPYRQANSIFRIEYRFDDSRGKAGGFFFRVPGQPDAIGLKPEQHLLIFGLIFTFESTIPRSNNAGHLQLTQ